MTNKAHIYYAEIKQKETNNKKQTIVEGEKTTNKMSHCTGVRKNAWMNDLFNE
jgi:hypothetical protein